MKFKFKFKYILILSLILLNIFPYTNCFSITEEGDNSNKIDYSSDEVRKEFKDLIETLFKERNEAVVNNNKELLKNFYDLDIKVSLYAYENEAKKTQYLINWSDKQAVKFKDITSIVKIRKIAEKEPDLYGIICDVATDFSYYYIDTPDVINKFRLGTNHYLNLKKINDKYIITKEWYTDPFADSLNLENIKSDDIKNYIINHEEIHLTLTKEQQKAIEYAHRYCGAAADEEFGLTFNKKYRDFNCDGGDCANFASQIMYESGKFKKNEIWNYDKGSATKAWVNAQGFKNYIVNSGRGSYIAKGSYEEVYREAYN